jgi:ribose 5-phosphate isomerase B
MRNSSVLHCVQMSLPKRIVLATDHAGYRLKETIKTYLIQKGMEIIDVGALTEDVEDDYPHLIRKGCMAVLEQKCLAIIFGGSGIGESMAANKIRGIRSARCCSEDDARLSRAHNDANVMSLGGRIIGEELAKKMVDIFLETSFEKGRHERRVKDIES